VIFYFAKRRRGDNLKLTDFTQLENELKEVPGLVIEPENINGIYDPQPNSKREESLQFAMQYDVC
jgi:hypothetical protein